MKQKYSYADCYKILNASTSQSFSEIRKAYKRHIQKWHPDRQHESQKEAASSKLQELTTAFAQIEQYYKENNILPSVEPPPTKTEAIKKTETTQGRQEKAGKANKKTSKPAKKQHQVSSRVPDSRPVISSILLSLAFITVVILYLNYGIDESNTVEDSSKPIVNSTKLAESKPTISNINKPDPAKLNSQSLTNQNKIKTKKKIADFFTMGSSVGDVIEIQGKPDKIVDDVWLYGESKVIFDNGVVIDWKRVKGHPIKARLIINPVDR